MPRVPSPAKRQSIVDAARSLFVRKGFIAVSMDEIAAQARVSKRTLYKHFENKDSLFGAILATEKETQPSAAAHPPFDANVALDEQLANMVKSRLADLFEPSRFEVVRMIIGETLRNPDLARQFGAELDAYSDLLAPWLAKATELGYLDVSEPEASSRLFWKGVLGIGFWPALLKNEPVSPPDFDKLVREWIASFLVYLGGSND